MVRFEHDGGEPDAGLAPVIPLFGEAVVGAPASTVASDDESGSWHRTWTGDPADDADDDREGAEGAAGDGDDDAREAAERALLRRLRTRSLSLREARSVLAEHGLRAEGADDVIETFLGRGYLDDAALAEQLVHSAVDRKGHGRQVISQTLAKRGIPRDVADAAIAALPDDDSERALEFARSKARSMSSLDHDAALRRLMGQLARRGYGGSIATNAARTALTEAGVGRSSVRFR